MFARLPADELARRAKLIRAARGTPIDPATRELLRAGKLDQTCPACQLEEAAHPYCSRCLTLTGVACWHRPRRSDAQRAAAVRVGALGSKENGLRGRREATAA